MGATSENLDGWFPTDGQVGQILGLLQQEFGEGLFNLTESALGACEAAFRFSAFARCLKLAREHHGVSVTAAAKALGVRQLKLTRMEQGGVPEAALLLRYAAYLGLDDYYGAWRKANPKLAEVFETEAAQAGVIEALMTRADGNGHGAGELPPFPGLNFSSPPNPCRCRAWANCRRSRFFLNRFLWAAACRRLATILSAGCRPNQPKRLSPHLVPTRLRRRFTSSK